MAKYPFFKQLDKMDCGPACLRMICKYHGKDFPFEFIRRQCHVSKSGVSILQLSEGANNLGLKSLYAKIGLEDLRNSSFPCIVHWMNSHFIVVYKMTMKTVTVGDPAIGILKYSTEDFLRRWIYKVNDPYGIVLFLEPSPKLYSESVDIKPAIGFHFFYNYLRPFKNYYWQLLLGMTVSLSLTFIFPFLTQSVIDVGINNKNLGFIQLILIAQVVLTFSSSVVSFIQNWIFLHIGARVNIAVISDYLIKLLKLPISYFDSKMTGDILQRISDHTRVQAFISNNTLNSLFSFVNLIVFSIVMAYYSLQIFTIFMAFSILYSFWVVLFLKKRKEFDYKFFEKTALRQNTLIQLIHGIKDIKLNNYENKKRWDWERIQVQTFKINVQQLIINQYQQAGAIFIDLTKNLIVSYLAAKLVIAGEMTLGMMLSMQYILGQLNAPISQFIGFINSYQDSKISLERIGEIHACENEENINELSYSEIPSNKTIRFENVSFSFTGASDQNVLKDINLTIPQNKITAIVGASGSGKTTILKLLLKFYSTYKGNIYIGHTELKNIRATEWRKICGSVMQDNYIFSDTIAENIAMGDQHISLEKLSAAAHAANINEFIEGLPHGYNTKIGADGVGVSQGQKQRMLIARAVYKGPEIIFLDEATNSLDAKNESEIINKLTDAFYGKTVVIVAHRLSTIRYADNILVFENGKIVESGSHDSLLNEKGKYYELITKQTDIYK